ncbi:hypothetical protein MTQ24_09810 [Corynebacterium bovis]
MINAPTGQALLPVADRPLRPRGGDRHLGWFVGVHGGAGATTCAAVMAPFADAGRIIPAADDPAICILVANTHRAGLRKAHEAVLQFDSGLAGSAHLAGVVLVHDCPGKLAKSLVGDVARITEATPGHNVWHIPHIPAWRTVLPADLPPAWEPDVSGQLATGSGHRRRRKTKPDPMRVVPDEVADVGEGIFDRCRSLFARINDTR